MVEGGGVLEVGEPLIAWADPGGWGGGGGGAAGRGIINFDSGLKEELSSRFHANLCCS